MVVLTLSVYRYQALDKFCHHDYCDYFLLRKHCKHVQQNPFLLEYVGDNTMCMYVWERDWKESDSSDKIISWQSGAGSVIKCTGCVKSILRNCFTGQNLQTRLLSLWVQCDVICMCILYNNYDLILLSWVFAWLWCLHHPLPGFIHTVGWCQGQRVCPICIWTSWLVHLVHGPRRCRHEGDYWRPRCHIN